MSNVIVNKYVFENPNITRSVTAVSLSDLHRTENGEQDIIKSLSNKIEIINPDFILAPGDLTNSPSCLKTKSAQERFREDMKRITGDRLFFFSKGNHEGMIMGKDDWIAVESTALEDTLSNLDNAIFLDNLDGFSLADPSLISKGYSTANIYIAGSSLPASYYIDEKESLEAYREHLVKMFKIKEKPFKADMLNILLLHDVRMLILLIERKMLPKDIVEQLVSVLANGGHYHSGGLTNLLASLIKLYYGLAAPSGQLFPTHVEGNESINGIHFIQNGYAGDFKPDSALINGVYKTFDLPAISEFEFIPGETTKLIRRRYKR